MADHLSHTGKETRPPLTDVDVKLIDRGARSDVRLDDLRPLATRRTVLVVDDEPAVLDVIARILARENYEVVRALSGPEALDLMGRRPAPIDLLITDYMMPDMTGRELARQVRCSHPYVRVLYQTGFSDALFSKHTPELERGAAFIEKPYNARGLLEAARLILFGSINPATDTAIP